MVGPAVFFSHLINSSVVTVWKVGDFFCFRPEEKIKKSVPNCLCQAVEPGNTKSRRREQTQPSKSWSCCFLREPQQNQILLTAGVGGWILFHSFDLRCSSAFRKEMPGSLIVIDKCTQSQQSPDVNTWLWPTEGRIPSGSIKSLKWYRLLQVKSEHNRRGLALGT